MKLVEVIILAGAHCISPLEHAEGLTVAAKVSCAVIVEKNTETNTVTVMPPWQASAPEVRVALSRAVNVPNTAVQNGRAMPAPELRIEPAAAPPEPAAPPAPVIAEGADQAPLSAGVDSANQPPDANQTPAGGQPQAAEASQTEDVNKGKSRELPVKLADAAPAGVPAAAKPDRPARTSSGPCMGGAKQAWYTNKDGRRKFRCVVPGKAKLY